MTCYAIVEIVKIHARLYVSVIKSARGKLCSPFIIFFEFVSRDIVTNSFMLKLQNPGRKIVRMHFNFCSPY